MEVDTLSRSNKINLKLIYLRYERILKIKIVVWIFLRT